MQRPSENEKLSLCCSPPNFATAPVAWHGRKLLGSAGHRLRGIRHRPGIPHHHGPRTELGGRSAAGTPLRTMGEWELSWEQDPCLLDGLVLLMRGLPARQTKMCSK